jgi:hypothetical protein
METERIALSQRERDRLRVLHDIRRPHNPWIIARSPRFPTATSNRPSNQISRTVGAQGKWLSLAKMMNDFEINSLCIGL